VHTFHIEEGEYRQDEDRGGVKEHIEGMVTKALTCEDQVPIKLHLRPGLHEYLKELTEVADVYAFTAAMSVYARPVINHLDPDKTIFKHIWYRESCTKTRVGNRMLYTKDLKTLGDNYDSDRTILVDNNVFCFLPQRSNGILVPAFYDNPNDNVLPQVLNVVKELQNERDVKPALHDMFDLVGHIEKMKKQM
jgi:Dullard-like phosphatase family protein